MNSEPLRYKSELIKSKSVSKHQQGVLNTRQKIEPSQESSIPKFKVDKKIGKGTFGVVYLATDLITKRKVAIKRVIKSYAEMSREVEILNIIKINPYCIQIYSTFYSTYQHEGKRRVVQNMVFEYMNYGLDRLLHSHRKEAKPISLHVCRKVMIGILKGLDFLHKLNIAHRDLKPDNVLLEIANENLEKVKLADFGQAKVLDPKLLTNAYIQSKNYRAPEIFLGLNYDTKVDIWSAGVIFIELLYLRKPMMSANELEQLTNLIDLMGMYEYSEFGNVEFYNADLKYHTIRLSKLKNKKVNMLNKFIKDNWNYESESHLSFWELISHMLVWYPNKRYSADQLLKLKFFKNDNVN